MKNKFNYFLIAFAFLLASCSVQKREHLGGYYIDWHKKDKNGLALKEKKSDNAFSQTSKKLDADEQFVQEGNSMRTESAEPLVSTIEMPATNLKAFKMSEANPSQDLEQPETKQSKPSIKEIAKQIKLSKNQTLKPKPADKEEVLNTVFSFVSFGLGIISLIEVIWAMVGLIGIIGTGLFATGGVPAILALLFGLGAFIIGIIFNKRGAGDGRFGIFLKLGKLFGLIGMIAGAVFLFLSIIFAVVF